jgi:hypothetical protein
MFDFLANIIASCEEVEILIEILIFYHLILITKW